MFFRVNDTFRCFFSKKVWIWYHLVISREATSVLALTPRALLMTFFFCFWLLTSCKVNLAYLLDHTDHSFKKPGLDLNRSFFFSFLFFCSRNFSHSWTTKHLFAPVDYFYTFLFKEKEKNPNLLVVCCIGNVCQHLSNMMSVCLPAC